MNILMSGVGFRGLVFGIWGVSRLVVDHKLFKGGWSSIGSTIVYLVFWRRLWEQSGDYPPKNYALDDDV